MPTDRIQALRNSANPDLPRPVAYGYCRVSHVKTREKGDSISSQQERIDRYYDAHLKHDGIDWGGCDDDGTNISAYKVPFFTRPAGKRLLAKLNPGDHLVIDKPDRIWRDMRDFCNLMNGLRKKRITVHIVSFLGNPIQNDSSLGEFILQVFVMVAQLDSAIKSERICESHGVMRRKGRVTSFNIPPGCKKVVLEHHGQIIKKLHWCPIERAVMRELFRLRDEEELIWQSVYPRIEQYEAELTGRDVRTIAEQHNDRKRRWPRLYQYELAFRYLSITDPSQIQKADVMQEAARQYRRVRAEKRKRARGTDYCGKHYSSPVEAISPEELLSLG